MLQLIFIAIPIIQLYFRVNTKHSFIITEKKILNILQEFRIQSVTKSNDLDLLSLLNLTKAFYIDDTFRLDATRHIQENSLKSMSGLITRGRQPT